MDFRKANMRKSISQIKTGLQSCVVRLSIAVDSSSANVVPGGARTVGLAWPGARLVGGAAAITAGSVQNGPRVGRHPSPLAIGASRAGESRCAVRRKRD
jgi:hypothetical protein